MVFRDTGLSPSLVRLSRRVLLNNKHNSLPLYSAAITSTCNAILATTVIFNSLILLSLKTLKWFGLIDIYSPIKTISINE